jgi:hypothetical protein
LYTGTAGWAAGRIGAFNGAPQLSQNASPAIAVVPHCGQTTEPELIGTAGAATAVAIGAVGGCAAIGGGVAAGVTGMSAAPH